MSGGFGFSDIKPGTTVPKESDQEAVDRAAEERGFVSRQAPSTIQRKKKPGPDGPVGQFNLRASVVDVNEFIEWCSEERMSYREGFSMLMTLKKRHL